MKNHYEVISIDERGREYVEATNLNESNAIIYANHIAVLYGPTKQQDLCDRIVKITVRMVWNLND